MDNLGRAGAYLGLFSQVGVALLVPLLIGILVGSWVDERLHTTPIFILIGLFVGMGSGWLVVYRLITRFLSKDE